ncbi:activating signal cointegrator 1 complex subunit 2-like isoform X2 [Stegodyphus dumicola]|uniref:activating signal cointegrator 1 complex subunit 2-like isoform X2 n=1 Tax=Stegodyphus dumicola TaxID=202533 RepID=UPI0015B176DF|nr:activating signal cointegrator 1 complex subunit 2-like isoform X2 [Stegodyphus dumicola]
MATKNNNTSSDPEVGLGEPLDTLKIKICGKNGVQKIVPAVNIGFMELRNYIYFKPPPVVASSSDSSTLNADEEEWLECMSFFKEDLQWLLKLPHHRFWSQIIYDENLHKCLESYLSQAPRDYDFVNIAFKEDILFALKKVHRLVFVVFLRMSTYKESKKHHIRPEAFGEMIYENFIFDVPKLMDLCVLYGFRNRSLLCKMVQNIFNTQPKYLNDLVETSSAVLAAFNSAEEKLFMNIPEKHGGYYASEDNSQSGIKELSLTSFCDIINYVCDTSATIYTFLEIYSPACQIFYQHGAVNRIVPFYEQVFPAIEKELKKRSKIEENRDVIEGVKNKIVLSKTFLVKVFRNIVNSCCIEPILNARYSEDSTKISVVSYVENFIGIFTEVAAEKVFLHDYNLLYPFENDLELLNEVGLNLDPERLSYIFCSIHDSPEMLAEDFASSVANGARPKAKKTNMSDVSNKSVKNLHGLAAMLKEKESQKTNGESDFMPDQNYLSGSKVKLLVQSVLDVFPDLDDGFVEQCLKYYSFEAEKVIDALLNNSLPDCLYVNKNSERDSTFENNEVVENVKTYSVLSERKNIYDNDEFDIFSRTDVNLKNIHIGKKSKTPNTYQGLEEDQDSEFIKLLTLNYGSNETDFNDEMKIYEDEYDDTYDSVMLGLKEPVPEGEPDKDEVVEDKKIEESQHTPDETAKQPGPNDFCTNPEILRERAEQRRQAKLESRGFRRGGVSANSNNSRQQKDRHKGQVANHNRRKQSDFKRSRGMGGCE